MNALVWVVALLLVGLAVMVLEVFVPSGGVLGFLSVLAIGAAIATAFLEQGVAAGMAVIAAAFVAVPVVLAVAFRWFPETPLGRRVLPPPPAPDDVSPAAASRRRLRELVGRSGTATSELLPWGVVEVGGQSCTAVSEGGPIPVGAAVEVVAVQAAAVVVRGLPAAASRPTSGGTEQPRSEPDAAAPLSKTLEEFDFEQLDPPAA